MNKRGRQSLADLSVVPIDVARRPIEPPADLKPKEAEIFRQVVASCDANHFRKSDIPIVTAFATATHLSRFYADRIGESEGAFTQWEKASRLQISLATKLRLTPQARAHPATVARMPDPHTPGEAPWE
jgi:phage terminase small subunit